MERIAQIEDVVELGDAIELTRGGLPVGAPDTDQVLFKIGEGIVDED
jgi:hypothetical protein